MFGQVGDRPRGFKFIMANNTQWECLVLTSRGTIQSLSKMVGVPTGSSVLYYDTDSVIYRTTKSLFKDKGKAEVRFVMKE